MAVDIYSGPLSRYFSKNWETTMARYARENNMDYTVVTPDGQSKDNGISSQEICEWLKNLSKTFGVDFDAMEKYQESYFTERVTDLEILYTANCYIYCDHLDINLLSSQKGLEFIQKETEEKTDFVFFRDVEAWFPINLPGSEIYQIEFPNGQERIISTTNKLLEALDHITNNIFGTPLDKMELNGLKEERFVLAKDIKSFEESAKFSLINATPIILDY
jgi:hypothetical protein